MRKRRLKKKNFNRTKKKKNSKSKWLNPIIPLIVFLVFGIIFSEAAFIIAGVILSLIGIIQIYINKVLNILQLLILWVFILGLIYFILGNQINFVLTIALILLGFTIIAIYNLSIDKEKEKQGAVLAGAGILLFTIISFLNSVPIFLTDGTDNCDKNFVFFLQEGNLGLDINDLTITNYGSSLGLITIKTQIYPENKVKCKYGCQISYIKFPYFGIDVAEPQRSSLSVQKTQVRLAIEDNVQYFRFTQQIITNDLTIQFLAQKIVPVRFCECQKNMKKNMFQCQSKKQTELSDWLASTSIFKSS